MSLPELAVPAAASALVLLPIVRLVIRCEDHEHDRLLRLFAGIAAIVCKDKRAKRAMKVLRESRRDRPPPSPGAGAAG
jgi:hypothetical protein